MAVKYNTGTSAGRAGSPLPAAIANQRFLIYRDGTHGVTRPTCPNVIKNCYKIGKMIGRQHSLSPKVES